MIDSLERGRDAMRRHAWAEAIEALTAADGAEALSPEDLELMSTAQWWSGHPDEATEGLERAFTAYSDAGRLPEAAWVAMTLAYQAFQRVNGPVGGGWLARAERLLADEPESKMHARLGVFHAFGAVMAGQVEQGIAIADRAMEIARRHDDANALYMAMSFKGMGQVLAGKWQDGLANIDESAAAASAGELNLRIASDIYCTTIAACRNVGDLGRAAQWAGEGERWMRRNGAGGYPGVCRVHRAELKMLHGQWSEAEQEARQACDELKRYRLLIGVGYAQYMIGEVRLRMGDLDGAAEAFDQAYEYGHDAQPGLALLQLARGEVDDARRSIDRALATAAGTGGAANRTARGRLLPAQVDIALATGDLETARQAVDELESIAGDFERPFFQAGAMTARGELLLGEEKAAEASPVLGQSWRLWQSTDLPYESAQARLHYAAAIAAEGDATAARRDLLAARSAFERLGATRDIQRVDALLGENEGAGAADSAGSGASHVSGRPAERVTRTFMFTDIVGSTDLVGLIGDEAWSEILRWHDRELRSAIAEHGGHEVDHTGDGFFVAFERAADGIEAAVDIQRRLVRHRREHGFAPWVRIGLHTAEATRKGQNFTGGGVHVAARVGAAAGKDEIVISRDVEDGAGKIRFGLSDPRSVTLKGVKDPLEVRSVEWR
ncbi:MAG TPA: adenylate/guanylate cyclase domain-containing protein [Candidatus Limnocylindria bacterium]|nr:adenylate/guanylate cyclase domain-containing protein [Candidatus Limnocylindria bacterium]